MAILWRLIGVLPQRAQCYGTPQKYLFHSCLLLRRAPRKCVFTGLRYRATDAVGGKAAKESVRSASRSSTASELKRLFALAAPEKWRLLSAIAFLLVSSSVTMAVPFSLGKVVDIIAMEDKEKMKERLNAITWVLVGMFIVGGICNCCRVYLMATAGYRITQNMRRKAYSAILRQETALFDKRSTGELVGRLSGDAQLISSAVTSNVSDGLRSGIMSITGVSMMLYMSPKLAMVGLSVVPVIAGLAVVYSRFLKKISREVQDSMAILNTTAEERIGNIRTVKAFGQEINEVKRYSSKLEDLLKLCTKESLYRAVFFGLTGFTGNTMVLFTFYYGGVMISDSSITIGTLSAFLMYAAYVGVSLNGLTSFSSELFKALGATTRLFELMDRRSLIPVQGGMIPNTLSGEITFRNVCFAYPTRKQLILRDFDLHVPKSSVTAIVGASGSGKSTVASLLLRLYDPDGGCILLDQYDLKDLDPMWVKSQIGVVFQEPVLFSGTIRENILYATENATEADLEEVARQAHVLEFVQRMNDGLDTVIGERGVTLSGGQRQRVAIARALIKKPRILILDEATSALDAESENLVQEALERAIHGRTVLTIAHRLSTIKNADKIVVLDQGRVAETGTYGELMSLDEGYFKKLVKHQSFT